ncbi:MAG: DNA polymerase III subunit delta' [Alphaproteobacteria bacterium]|nr:DNA polymerase III subunit delta' [Alphaproteobacteria bacterium]
MTDAADLPVLSPLETPDLFGQAAAERALLAAYRSGRMHHAWLLTGPKGVGKATLAVRFTRWLLAGGEGRNGAEPDALALDAAHPVFRRIASCGHADVVYIERGINEKTGRPRTEISVDDTRKMGAFFRLTAAEGGWRVVIVDDAELMSRAAANSLLKPLEEPPHNSLIFIITSAPGRLLPTIRSRCRRLHLPALGQDDLRAVLAAQRPELAGDDREALLRLAKGSAGRALSFAALDGVALRRELGAILGRLPRMDVPAVHALCDRLAKPAAQDAYRVTCGLLRDWVAEVTRAAATGAAAPPDAGEGSASLAATRLSPRARAGGLWEDITTLFAQEERANLDRKQVLLSAILAVDSALRSAKPKR